MAMDGLRRTLAKVPMAGVALGSMVGIVAADLGVWSAWALLPAALALVFFGGRHWLTGAGFAAGAVFLALHGPRLERQAAGEAWAIRNGRVGVAVEGTVLSLRDADGIPPGGLVVIDRSARNPADLRGVVIGVRQLPAGVKPGDCLKLRGAFSVQDQARNPGEFDRREWMRTCGIAAELRVDWHEIAGHPDPRLALHRLAWDLRLEMRERIVAGLDEGSVGAALIRGLVLGDLSSGGEELYGAFRTSGTMHVFAVSGLHVGLVGMLGWLLMKPLRISRASGLWAVMVLLWVYSFVTGLRPPAMRAALMASMFLLGFALKRQPSLANSLLASLPPVLLLDSFQLHQAGLQLSYTVVAMIIVLGPWIFRRLRFAVDADPFLPRSLYSRTQAWALDARKKTVGLFAVSLAAWVGSVPLIGAHFGMVTPIAVVASMVLIPITFANLSLALLGVLVGLVAEPLEIGMNRVNAWLMVGAYRLAQEFSEVPGSHFALRGSGGWPEGILVYDLSDGDGAIYCGAGEGILIDGGASDQFERAVVPALREAGLAPGALVLTHPDGGHAGGLVAALAEFEIRQVLLPVREARSPAFRDLLRLTGEAGVPQHFGHRGARYPLGDGAELEVLRVAAPGSGNQADDRGMVLRLHWRGWQILITGDSGFETEKELLAGGADLRSDVWIMGRHASDYTGGLDFVQAVSPRVIVASEEPYPEAERVPGWWAAAVERAGIELWRQSATGAVEIEVEAGEVRLRSFLEEGRVLRLTR